MTRGSFKEDLIPKVIFYKEDNLNSDKNLIKYINLNKLSFNKSYQDNNISASNILTKNSIVDHSDVEHYKLAITRVGNSSIGKSGLINIKTDILNDMFYVFDFNSEINKNVSLKEMVCKKINENREYFTNISSRVGSKSIKKEDVLNFPIF